MRRELVISATGPVARVFRRGAERVGIVGRSRRLGKTKVGPETGRQGREIGGLGERLEVDGPARDVAWPRRPGGPPISHSRSAARKRLHTNSTSAVDTTTADSTPASMSGCDRVSPAQRQRCFQARITSPLARHRLGP